MEGGREGGERNEGGMEGQRIVEKSRTHSSPSLRARCRSVASLQNTRGREGGKEGGREGGRGEGGREGRRDGGLWKRVAPIHLHLYRQDIDVASLQNTRGREGGEGGREGERGGREVGREGERERGREGRREGREGGRERGEGGR